jgi:hypothetical protein
MSEFTTIETQEQLDAILKDRRARQEKKLKEQYEEKYKGYISPDDASKQVEDLTKQVEELGNSLKGATDKAKADGEMIASLEASIKAHETASVKSRIAHEVGLPYELANKLSGETEEDIRKDAEALLPFVSKQTAPLRDPEGTPKEPSTRESFAEWAKTL